MSNAGGSWQIDRRASFDRVAADYDARPSYPSFVYERLRRRAGIGRGSRVLEIGPGTGQATVDLVELGASVTAVELGQHMADRLRERLPGVVEVIVGPFESVPLELEAFDAVVSATAFHWIDPGPGLAKVAAVLRDGGWLALWWTLFGDDSRPDPFEEELRALLMSKAPHLVDEGAASTHYSLDTTARIAEIDATGAFGPVTHEILAWDCPHSPEQLRGLFATFSPFLALPDDLRDELLVDIESIARDQLGGLVTRPYLTVQYLARRLDRDP